MSTGEWQVPSITMMTETIELFAQQPAGAASRASDASNRYKIRYTRTQLGPHRGRSTTTAEFPASTGPS